MTAYSSFERLVLDIDDTQAPAPATVSSRDPVTPVLARFAARMLQEAMTSVLPIMWIRRAETLEAARPRPEEFHGRATQAELSERWQRLTDEAMACREHAAFLMLYPDALKQQIDADIAAVMGIDEQAVVS